MSAPREPSRQQLEEEARAHQDVDYHLTLFVNGASDMSAHAIANARQLCESHLTGRYRLSIVDVHDDPDAVLSNRVFATPTLVKNWPLPVRRLVGDLSSTDKVVLALDLPVTEVSSRAVS